MGIEQKKGNPISNIIVSIPLKHLCVHLLQGEDCEETAVKMCFGLKSMRTTPFNPPMVLNDLLLFFTRSSIFLWSAVC